MNHRFHISRRGFLSRCAAVAAATGLPLWFVKNELARAEETSAKLPSANDRPGVALIGCGGMGMGDAANAQRFGDIVAVSDVDQNHLDAAAMKFTRDGKVPAKYPDFRRLLENKDVQLVIQATPDHWHTLINIAALNSGKDVFGQKPLTLTIEEGSHVIKAVRNNKAVFQTGTQQRSDRRFRLACELVRNGRIGKLKNVNVFVPAGLKDGPFTGGPVPKELNWDFWLGQAPQVDYLKKRVHANFRWWFDYSGGPVTDWGAHHNDIARWGIGQDGPLKISAKITNPAIPGGYTTPKEFEAALTWADGITQAIRTTTDETFYGEVVKKDGQRNGVKFEGSEGWVWVNRNEIDARDDKIISTPLPDNAIRLPRSDDHMGNFFECARSRKDPVATVENGHRSAVIGHLVVIALRTGLDLEWNPAQERFTGENAAVANRFIAREMRKPYDYTFVG